MKFCCRRSIKASHLRAILSYGLCCRSDMKEAKGAAESAPADNQRASLIRATKMSAACRLFIDFLFVASSAKIDSIIPKTRLLRRPELSKICFRSRLDRDDALDL